DRDVVRRALVDERIGDPGRERVHQRRSGRTALLGALVAFHAARVVVFGLALLVSELHAVDSAVAGVHHVEVVDEPAENPRAARRARPKGSTTRKKTMSAPNRIRVRLDTSPAGRARPNERSIEAAERSMKIGSSTMKPAPRNEPRMLPTPPMMIMKRILKESSSSN